MEVLLWLLQVHLVYSAKISSVGSEGIKQNCGKHFLEDRKSFKSFGGRKLKLNEFPWIATVSAREFICTGVLISPRHILTAAHCVVESPSRILSEVKCRKERHRNRRRFRASVSEWMVKFGSLCPKICVSVDTAKIYVHDKFDECSAKNDIAIFELAVSMPSSLASPICLPQREFRVSKKLKVAGYGRIGPDDDDEDHNSIGHQVIDVAFVESDGTTITVESAPRIGLCKGDSGGPLFQDDEKDRSTLMGILSHGSSCEWNFYAAQKRQGKDVFTDVREHLDWIHEKSGADPAERSQMDGSAEQSQTEQNKQNNGFGIVRDVASVTNRLKWVCKVTGLCLTDSSNVAAMEAFVVGSAVAVFNLY